MAKQKKRRAASRPRPRALPRARARLGSVSVGPRVNWAALLGGGVVGYFVAGADLLYGLPILGNWLKRAAAKGLAPQLVVAVVAAVAARKWVRDAVVRQGLYGVSLGLVAAHYTATRPATAQGADERDGAWRDLRSDLAGALRGLDPAQQAQLATEVEWLTAGTPLDAKGEPVIPSGTRLVLRPVP